MDWKTVLSMLVVICCIAVNAWKTHKTIEDGAWLESHGYPRAMGSHPLAFYLTWLISVGILYAYLPFTPPMKALITIPLFILGTLAQGKIISFFIARKVARLQNSNKEAQ